MSILVVLIVVAAAGFLVWLVNSRVPMDPTFKTVFNILAVVLLVIFVLQALGVWSMLLSARV